MDLGDVAHRALRLLPAETAHDIGVWGMKHRIFATGSAQDVSGVILFDHNFRNRLGIAAGFDKYAQIVDRAEDYGFAWIEEGSFTNEGGEGNPGKRLFRLENGGLLNRMGLNCLPSVEAAEILRSKRHYSFAVSIAKTHNPSIVGDKAIRDVARSYKILKDLGIYTAINLSCPNTAEGKTFEESEPLLELLSALNEVGKGRPRIIKLSPNLPLEKLAEIVHVSEPHVDGYELGNTIPYTHSSYGKGGRSGPYLRDWALNSISRLAKLTSKPILGCGGISSGQDLYDTIKAGATVALVYSGFVSYQGGSGFANRVNRECETIMRKNPIITSRPK